MSDQSELIDLHLVSERFIAEDGLDATRIRTDEEAANLVLDSAWLAERDKRMKTEALEDLAKMWEASSEAFAYAMDEEDWAEIKSYCAAVRAYAATLQAKPGEN